jgi:hypothetical protein
MRWILTLAALAVLAAAGASLARVRAEPPPVVVTRDSAAFVPDCGPREIAQLVWRFADALTRADGAALDAVLAPAGQFERFYLPGAGETLDREDVLALARGARFQLLAVGAVSGDEDTALAYATLELDGVRRSAKAKIRCDTKTVYALVVYPRPAAGSECGVDRANAFLACAIGPTAHALAPGFRVEATPLRLRGLCAPNMVKARLTALLLDFNGGDGAGFRRSFTPRSHFHPYTASRGPVARAAIAAFVRERYRAGDGWTATTLLPPRGSSGRSRAVYGAALRVTRQGQLLADLGAKVVVDCRSGLIATWIGPAL